MRKYKIWFVVLFICLCPSIVSAHPGGLDGNGCHTCRTNCSKWGLSSGQYHCHGGGTTNNKSTSSNTNKKQVQKSTTKKTTNKSNINKSSNKTSNKVVVKSTNANLKSLSINGDNVDIKDFMEYRTSTDVVKLEAVPYDSKAIVKYDSDVELNDGSNKVNIKVVAEDTSVVKNYVVDVIKLSSDTNIEVYIDGELIELDSNNVFNTYNDAVDIEYKAVNENATVEVNGNDDKLAIGDNIVTFIVTAEDGTRKEYFVNIKRNSTNNVDNVNKVNFEILLKKLCSTNSKYKILFKIIYFIFYII